MSDFAYLFRLRPRNVLPSLILNSTCLVSVRYQTFACLNVHLSFRAARNVACVFRSGSTSLASVPRRIFLGSPDVTCVFDFGLDAFGVGMASDFACVKIYLSVSHRETLHACLIFRARCVLVSRVVSLCLHQMYHFISGSERYVHFLISGFACVKCPSSSRAAKRYTRFFFISGSTRLMSACHLTLRSPNVTSSSRVAKCLRTF